MVSGWLPVAWGRGCLLIGNSDKPLPEGEVEDGSGNSLNHLRPEGWWDFTDLAYFHVSVSIFDSHVRSKKLLELAYVQ